MNVRYFRNDDFVTRAIAGETILVPVRAHAAELDAVFTLNEVGSLIWHRLDGQGDLEPIVAALCAAYAVGRDEAAKDVADFLEELRACGLIRVEPAERA